MKLHNNSGIAYIGIIILIIFTLGTVTFTATRVIGNDEPEVGSSEIQQESDNPAMPEAGQADAEESQTEEATEEVEKESSAGSTTQPVAPSQAQEEQATAQDPEPSEPELMTVTMEGFTKGTSGTPGENPDQIQIQFIVEGPSSGTCGLSISREGTNGGAYHEVAVQPFDEPDSSWPEYTGLCDFLLDNPDGHTPGTYQYTGEYLANSTYGSAQYSSSIEVKVF